jgi:hypothetical protein
MNRSTLYKSLLGLAVALCILTAPSLSQALIITAKVAPTGGGLFHYDFSITNDGLEDVVLASIVDAPTGDADIDNTLFAPAGFLASYDSGLGIVDFLSDADLFAVGTTKKGFGFDSSSGPTDGFFDVFTALTINGDELAGQVQQQVIPEPSTIALLALGLSVFVLPVARRKFKPAN